MPVFKRDVELGPKPPADMVTCKVTARGNGKVSTGRHDSRDGEEFFAAGETFELERELAEVLADENGDRRYVTIIAKAKAA